MYPLKVATRSIKRITHSTFKTVGEIFTLARNSTYNAEDLTKALIETCIQNSSAEQCRTPSSDTMLRRLRQVDENAFGQIFKGLNTKLLKKLDLRRRVVMALDFMTLPYYGAVQQALVSDSRLPGTRFGVRFAMLSMVEDGRTFVLGVKQVTPFHSKVGIVKEMLGRVPLKPKMLLLDRGFYAVEVILVLKLMGIHFLMPAKRTAPSSRRVQSPHVQTTLERLSDFSICRPSGRPASAVLITFEKLHTLACQPSVGWSPLGIEDGTN